VGATLSSLSICVTTYALVQDICFSLLLAKYHHIIHYKTSKHSCLMPVRDICIYIIVIYTPWHLDDTHTQCVSHTHVPSCVCVFVCYTEKVYKTTLRSGPLASRMRTFCTSLYYPQALLTLVTAPSIQQPSLPAALIFSFALCVCECAYLCMWININIYNTICSCACVCVCVHV